MRLTPEQQERAKQRRLKEPLEITGYEITTLRVRTADGPQTKKEFVTRSIRTIGDIAKLDAHCKVGKFIPLPDLSLQALMIVIDKQGLLEDEKKDGPKKVVEP